MPLNKIVVLNTMADMLNLPLYLKSVGEKAEDVSQ